MDETEDRPPGDGGQPPAFEVEVKVAANHSRVSDRLEAIGARSTGAVVQEDTYFDAPHRSFVETDEALRVRRERPIGAHSHPEDAHETGDGPSTAEPTSAGASRSSSEETVELTYKGPLVDAGSKTRSEFETTVEDGDTVETILDRLGFEASATVRKERRRFDVEGVTVSLDSVDDVGTYVEVERAADESAIEATRADLYAVLESLGLDPDEQIRTSYLGLKLGSGGQ